MLKRVFTILCVTMMLPFVVNAAEPVFDRDHALTASGAGKKAWRWRIASEEPDTLLVFDAPQGNPVARYDISDCMFCAGEEDNCDRDGIFGIAGGDAADGPAFAVACHVGAHSQSLRIFQPQKDAAMPVRSFTGSYFVDYRVKPNGLMIWYDRGVGDGVFTKVTVHWP